MACQRSIRMVSPSILSSQLSDHLPNLAKSLPRIISPLAKQTIISEELIKVCTANQRHWHSAEWDDHQLWCGQLVHKITSWRCSASNFHTSNPGWRPQRMHYHSGTGHLCTDKTVLVIHLLFIQRYILQADRGSCHWFPSVLSGCKLVHGKRALETAVLWPKLWVKSWQQLESKRIYTTHGSDLHNYMHISSLIGGATTTNIARSCLGSS